MELPSGAGRVLFYVELTLTKPTQTAPEGRPLRKFWGLHCDVAEDNDLMGRDAASLRACFLALPSK